MEGFFFSLFIFLIECGIAANRLWASPGKGFFSFNEGGALLGGVCCCWPLELRAKTGLFSRWNLKFEKRGRVIRRERGSQIPEARAIEEKLRGKQSEEKKK